MRDSLKGSPGPGSSSTVYVPSFLHHLRVLVALIPCWLLILSISGRIMLGTVGFFAAVASFLYSLRLYNASLLIIVGGITVVNVLQLLIGTTLLSTSIMFSFMLIGNTAIIALTGSYLSLLFPYIYKDHKLRLTAAIAEKMLFVVLPLLASSLLTWGAINVFGVTNGPYWMLLLQIISYLIFGLPQKSSFTKIQSSTEIDQPLSSENASYRETEMIGGVKYTELICNELLSYFQALQLFLPLGLHAATFWRSIFLVWPSTIGEWTHLTDILVLMLVPLLMFGILGTVGRYNPLWWSRAAKHQTKLYKIFLLVSIFVLIPCFEFRVIYFAFNHLLSGLSTPYNYIALTLAFYAFVLSITLHLRSGTNRKSSLVSTNVVNPHDRGGPPSSASEFTALVASQMIQARKLSYFLAVSCALNLSLALGIPVYLWPAPIIASIAFISFYFERRWWMYVLFVVGLQLGLLWFMYKSFFGLKFSFFTLAGYITIQIAAGLILILAALAAVIAGLIILNIYEKQTQWLLIIQAALLATMEEILHMELLSNDLEIYPAYLVVITTVFGVMMARKLKNDGRINTNVLFIVSMIYISKLALLLKPVSWPTISAMLLLSPPLYLVFKLWDAQNVLVDVSKSNTICSIYVIWMFFATTFNRWTLFQRLLEVLAGEIHDHASPALVHGLSFVFFGALLPPLAWHHPYVSENQQSNDFSTRRRRLISFSGFAIIAVGFAAMTSQQLFGSKTSQQVLGSGVMSSILGMRTGLPMISMLALLALILIIALIFTGTIDVIHSARQRISTSMAIGLAFGAFLSPFAISTTLSGIHAAPEDPSPIFITLGICMMFQLVALVIAFADWRTIGARAKWISIVPKLGPAAYVFMWLQWPLLFLGVLMVSFVIEEWRLDELESYNIALIAVEAFAQATVAVCLKFLEPSDPTKPSTRASWIPDVANIASLSAFALAVLVNYVTFGSDFAIVVLSPILLTMQPAGSLAPLISKRNPYFLVYIAIAVGLLAAAQSSLWLHGPFNFVGQIMSIAFPDLNHSTESEWSSFFMEMGAQFLLLPSSISIGIFFWNLRLPASFQLAALFTWLSMVALYLTDVHAAMLLAGINILLEFSVLLYMWIQAAPEPSRPLIERT